MHNVAVTGGAGFLGQYTVRELQKRGYEATALDIQDGWDSQNAAVVMDALQGQDAVIHLAGVLGTEELYGIPQQAVTTNVLGAVNVLEACKRYGIPYVATDLPDIWKNIYQATKACAREIALSYHMHQGLPVTIVRPYNAYGPGQKVHGVQKLVPTFAHNAWRGLPLPVWGDGQQVVDLVWAGDIAKVLVDALTVGGHGETIEAGTGKAMTVQEVAQSVLALTGSDSPIQYLPMRKGEHNSQPPVSGSSGWGLLEWKPQWEPGLFADTVAWYHADRP